MARPSSFSASTSKSSDHTKEIVKNFDEVYFTFNGQELLAQVERYSANQIEVITPRFSLTPLTADQNGESS